MYRWREDLVVRARPPPPRPRRERGRTAGRIDLEPSTGGNRASPPRKANATSPPSAPGGREPTPPRDRSIGTSISRPWTPTLEGGRVEPDGTPEPSTELRWRHWQSRSMTGR